MGDAIASGGRPESETDTPVNIGNGPYCDNGEGVAARPPPYPLSDAVGVFGAKRRRELTDSFNRTPSAVASARPARFCAFNAAKVLLRSSWHGSRASHTNPCSARGAACWAR